MCVGYSVDDDLRAACPTLAEDIVAKLEFRSAWGLRHSELVRRARSVISEHGLVGLALVWNQTPFPRQSPGPLTNAEVYYLDPPSPIGIEFEPIELNQNDSRLGLITGDGPITIRRERLVPSLGRPASYSSILAFAFASLPIAFVASAVSTLACCAIPLLTVLCSWILLRFRPRPQWFLIPGGVLVRQWPWFGSKCRLDVLTPGDTILLIYPAVPGWTVEAHGRKRMRRFVTNRECVALLRAWQSLVPPPTGFDDFA